MSYYIRVLSTATGAPAPHELAPDGHDAQSASGEEDWPALRVQTAAGREIAVVERNPVLPGSLGEEEIGTFLEEIDEAEPASARAWLTDYLPRVRTIFAVQVLCGPEQEEEWDALQEVVSTLWHFAPGIIQSDGEGFTNEEGYHILWQFADDVDGPWTMAVLDRETWVPFQMRLDDAEHRAAFRAGRVPAGAMQL
ncbi:MAG: hypothetical protein AAGD14_09435 [Planctomycetota bacterium]